MARSIYFFCFILSILFTNQSWCGEIYKWKDKNGKTYYSEKKPENADTVESVDTDHDKSYNPVKTLTGIKNVDKGYQRHVVVVRPENFWQLPNSQERTTAYYFGGDCVSPLSVSFQSMKENHRRLLPLENNLIDYVVNSIDTLDYSVSSSLKKPLYKNLARYENPVVLRFHLNDFIYHLCVENLHRQYRNHKKVQTGSNPFDFSIREFKKRRATLILGWSLYDATTNKELYHGATAGSADYWNKDVIKYRLNVLEEAFKNATTNLLSDRNFVKRLTNINKRNMSKKIPIPKIKDKSLIDSFGDIFTSNIIKKTEFSKVLTAASPLKIMATEYYLIEGAWPTSLTDIRVSRFELFERGYVKNIQFDYDGAIVLSLDPQKFGDDATISLQPEVTLRGGRIDWKCLTNLDNSNHGNYCESVE